MEPLRLDWMPWLAEPTTLNFSISAFIKFYSNCLMFCCLGTLKSLRTATVCGLLTSHPQHAAPKRSPKHLREEGKMGERSPRFSLRICVGEPHFHSLNANFMFWPAVRIWDFIPGGKKPETTPLVPYSCWFTPLWCPPQCLPHSTKAKCWRMKLMETRRRGQKSYPRVGHWYRPAGAAGSIRKYTEHGGKDIWKSTVRAVGQARVTLRQLHPQERESSTSGPKLFFR